MTQFASDQYIILALVFVLGLVLGMYLLSGGKWKRRYRDEVRRREALDVEHQQLRKQHAHMLPVDPPAGPATAAVHRETVTETEVRPVQPPASRWGFGRAKH